jgi:hypothetical protein
MRSSCSGDASRSSRRCFALVLAVHRASGFTLSRQRLPDGGAKRQILRAVEQARTCIPLRALLRILRLSPSRFHAWQRQDTCALDDQSSCPRMLPHRLTPAEVRVIEEMVTSPAYGTSEPARSPCSLNGSGGSGPPRRPGTASYVALGGGALGSVCIRRNRR